MLFCYSRYIDHYKKNEGIKTYKFSYDSTNKK